jgi:hypothetical protein
VPCSLHLQGQRALNKTFGRHPCCSRAMRSMSIAGRGPSSNIACRNSVGVSAGTATASWAGAGGDTASVVSSTSAQRSRQGKLDGVESLQTALGAMPHSVLGCHCLGIGLQDAAAAQETDRLCDRVRGVVVSAFRK